MEHTDVELRLDQSLELGLDLAGNGLDLDENLGHNFEIGLLQCAGNKSDKLGNGVSEQGLELDLELVDRTQQEVNVDALGSGSVLWRNGQQ